MIGFFLIKKKNFNFNVTFKLKEGKITLITGESGSGKSTFLNCLSGIIKPKKSFLEVNNKIIQNQKNNIFKLIKERKIGYVFQNPCIFPNMNILKNIKFGIKKKYINISYIINEFNLKNIIYKMPNDISGGEIQRVSIAQIILTKPDIILLDEPFSSQDIKMKKKIIKILKEINNNTKTTIIYVSHENKKIKNFTDEIFYMKKGKIHKKIKN